jgi:hypothetical protein
MTNNIEHLILEQFLALRNQIEGLQTEMRNDFSDVKHRINRLLPALGEMRPEQPKISPDNSPLLIGLRSESIELNIG